MHFFCNSRDTLRPACTFHVPPFALMSVCSLVDELSKKATEKTVTSPDTSKQHQLKRAKLDNQG